MQSDEHTPADEGGDPACWAHLFDNEPVDNEPVDGEPLDDERRPGQCG